MFTLFHFNAETSSSTSNLKVLSSDCLGANYGCYLLMLRHGRAFLVHWCGWLCSG